MDRRKIVIVTQYFPPEIGGGAHRSVGLAEKLAALGAEVTVVAPFPSYLLQKPPGRRRFRLYEKSLTPCYALYRTFVIATNRRTFLKRIIYYLSFAFSTLCLFLFEIDDADFVLAISPPVFTGIAGVLAKRLFGCTFIFDVGDLWAEAAIQLRILQRPRSIRLARRLERWIYRNADWINTVTFGSFRRFVDDTALTAHVALVPNFVDTTHIRKGERDSRLVSRLGLRGKMVFGYTGNIGHAQGIHTIIHAAQRTRHLRDIAYLVVGEGVERPDVEALIREYKLENVLLLPPVAREEIPAYMSLIDVMIIPLVKAALFAETIPSKLYESMAAEIPVILCVDGEARRMVESVGCGVYVEPENPSRLAAAVLDFYHHPGRLREMGARGRPVAEERFAVEKVVADFWNALHARPAESGDEPVPAPAMPVFPEAQLSREVQR